MKFDYSTPLAVFAEKSRRYGHLNSYDILKFVALITMVTDHIGVYVFDDAQWLRLAGRASMPLFLFLVGYCGKYETGKELLAGAIIVAMGAAIFHYPLFPLNILFTIIIARMSIFIIHKHKILPTRIFDILLLCLVFFIPTKLLTDYGSVGVLFAISGYMLRFHRQWRGALWLLATTFVIHFVIQVVDFGFTMRMAGVLAIIFAVMFYFLLRFRSVKVEFPLMSASVQMALMAISRNTLWLYVIHLLVLMAIGNWFAKTANPSFIWINV